jgi:hypothetical protein
VKTLYEHDSFDSEQYVKQKVLKIIGKNEEAKLSLETLAELADAGRRLVPPIDDYSLKASFKTPEP